MLRTQANVIGEPIAELKGKIIGQRVVDGNGTIETSLSVKGRYKEIEVKANKTFYGTPTLDGILRGEGKGVIMTITGVSEVASYTGAGVGTPDLAGNTKWRGAIFYSTSSTGRLAFLNHLIGVFKSELDSDGNFSEKIWEWK